MSDLAYHIATEHKLRFHEPSLTTTCSLPTCGMEPRLVYDESSLATVQVHHVAQVTEAAVREQIAAEIEQQAHSRDDLMRVVRAGGSTDWVTGWDAATLTAAEIARGES